MISIFNLFFYVFVNVLYDVFLSLSCTTCDLCRLNTIIWFLSSCCNVFLYISDSNSKTKSIKHEYQIKSWSLFCCKTGVICILIIIELSNV